MGACSSRLSRRGHRPRDVAPLRHACLADRQAHGSPARRPPQVSHWRQDARHILESTARRQAVVGGSPLLRRGRIREAGPLHLLISRHRSWVVGRRPGAASGPHRSEGRMGGGPSILSRGHCPCPPGARQAVLGASGSACLVMQDARQTDRQRRPWSVVAACCTAVGCSRPMSIASLRWAIKMVCDRSVWPVGWAGPKRTVVVPL